MGEVVYAKFSSDYLKKLRDETQMSLADCRKALEEANWDLDVARDTLLAQNRDKAKLKSDRLVTEGRIANYNHNGRIAAMVEVGCETDFAANTQEFVAFCDTLLFQIVGTSPLALDSEGLSEQDLSRKAQSLKLQGIEGEEDFEKAFESWFDEVCLMRQKNVNTSSGNKTMEELRLELSAKLGENVVVKRFVRWSK